jgi:hypothetical protein
MTTKNDKTERFNGTIEFLGGGRAIVELTDSRGEWSGAGRIEIRSRDERALYEAGYVRASACAAAKGGTLDTFRVVA